MAPTEPDSQSSCKVALASTMARALLTEVQHGVSQATSRPYLVGYLANNDPAAQILKTAMREDIEEQILQANDDPSIHGIIVYYPIFGGGQDQYLQNIVSTRKDVEGLGHQLVFNLYQNVRFLNAAQTQKSILPCTPLAIVKILEYLQVYNPILPYGNRLFGRTVTVINRSEVVGRPLAALLANDGACVYSVDVDGVQKFTRGTGIRKRRHEVEDMIETKLEDALLLSDVVVSGVPSEMFKVPLEHIRDGAVCINFSSEKNFMPAVKDKASIYVPAIGKVTIAILLRNLLRLERNQQHEMRQAIDQPLEHT